MIYFIGLCIGIGLCGVLWLFVVRPAEKKKHERKLARIRSRIQELEAKDKASSSD